MEYIDPHISTVVNGDYLVAQTCIHPSVHDPDSPSTMVTSLTYI